MENGKKFIIEADGNSKDNVYIQSALLNGNPYTRNYLTYGDITAGGLLKLTMGNRPAVNRGIGQEDKPFSLSE